MKSKRMFGLACLAALVLMACNLPVLAQSLKSTEANPANPGPDVTIANQPIPTETSQPVTPESPTPNPPTSSPDLTETKCVVGTWTIDDLSPYVISALPQDLVQQYQITYNNMSGHVYLTFNADQTMSMQADKLLFNFSGKLGFVSVPLTVSVDGPASGSYQVDDTNLATENVDTNHIQASAQILGQDLIDPPTIISAIPLLSPPANTAKYECNGDILQLRILAFPENIPSLVFSRMN